MLKLLTKRRKILKIAPQIGLELQCVVDENENED